MSGLKRRDVEKEVLPDGKISVLYIELGNVIMRRVYRTEETAQITIDAWLYPEFY